MPVTPTYPGVYVQEIASGVRTITGVATSITALIGWAPKGPIDRAELVLSWSDYERKFGGLNRQPSGRKPGGTCDRSISTMRPDRIEMSQFAGSPILDPSQRILLAVRAC